MSGYPIAVWQGVGKRDGGTEAFNRSVDVGAEKDIVLAIGKQDQGGLFRSLRKADGP